MAAWNSTDTQLAAVPTHPSTPSHYGAHSCAPSFQSPGQSVSHPPAWGPACTVETVTQAAPVNSSTSTAGDARQLNELSVQMCPVGQVSQALAEHTAPRTRKNGSASPPSKILLPLPVNPGHRGRTLTRWAQPRSCNRRDEVGATAVPRIRCGQPGRGNTALCAPLVLVGPEPARGHDILSQPDSHSLSF